MYAHLPRPTIFAHRGASAHAPENTRVAFQLGLQQGADAIELDTKLSADGVVVVIHDVTVDRTTDGSGAVNKLSLQALKELDAGIFFDLAFRGERIPTLEEVFDVLGKQTFINIELTNYTTPNDALPEKVADLVINHNLQDRVLFSSFNPSILHRIHRLLPSVPIGLLASSGGIGALTRSWLGYALCRYQALHSDSSDVTPRLVERLHRFGQRIHAYTVNHPKEMHRLFNLDVDGIFTNDPALARQVLSRTNLKAKQ